MSTLILYSCLTTCLYYLVARAKITEFLWSRYPVWLDSFTFCAACSGTWYGFLVAWVFKRDFLGLPGNDYFTMFVVGLCSMIWTPLVAYIHHHAMIKLGTFAADEKPTPVE